MTRRTMDWRVAGPCRRRTPAGAALIALAVACAAGPAHGQDARGALRERGKALFTGGATPACAICHTLENAGATGAVGPSLDELKPDAARVEAVLRKGMGVMPAYTALSEEDIKALAEYVSAATHIP